MTGKSFQACSQLGGPLTLGQLIDSLDSLEQSGGELDIDSVWLRHGWVLVARDATVIRDADGESLNYFRLDIGCENRVRKFARPPNVRE